MGTIRIENVSFNRVGNERPATENLREERLSFLLVVSLIGVEHTYRSAFWSVHEYPSLKKALLTIEPGKELLSAVVGVEDDGAESRKPGINFPSELITKLIETHIP